MEGPRSLTLKIVEPNKVLFDGQADYLMAPGPDGMLGIMPGHTPMFAELVKGDIYIHGKQEKVITINEGILKVRADHVVILAFPPE